MFKKIIIHKYGGKSLSNIENIKKISIFIKNHYKNSYKICVVVSAILNVTDNLIKLSKQLSNNPVNRELDMLLSCGEKQSISLLSISLNNIDVPTVSLTGSQAGIFTTNNHIDSKIIFIKNERLVFELGLNKVVIIAGFQGISINREITTLGRGGSDITAVAISISLCAIKCEIYTDIQGIYCIDPKIVNNNYLFNNLNYSEAIFSSCYGFKILNGNSVFLAKNNNLLVGSYGTNFFKNGTFLSSFKTNFFSFNNFFCFSYEKNFVLVKIESLEVFLFFLFFIKILNINFKQFFFYSNSFFLLISTSYEYLCKFFFLIIIFFFKNVTILSLKYKNNISNFNYFFLFFFNSLIYKQVKFLLLNYNSFKINFIIFTEDIFFLFKSISFF